MKVLAIVLWVGVCGAVCISGLILLGGMTSANGAPQEAVVICLALAVAVIPYIFARAITEIAKMNDGAKSGPQASTQPASGPVPAASEYKYNYQKIKREGSMLDLD